MADRYEAFACQIPAQTMQTAPLVVPLTFPEGVVIGVDVVIPDGVAGLAGFQIAYGGQQIIPNTPGNWIVGNDETVQFPTEGGPTGALWQLTGYNLDVFPHTFYVRIAVNEIPLPAPTGALLSNV